MSILTTRGENAGSTSVKPQQGPAGVRGGGGVSTAAGVIAIAAALVRVSNCAPSIIATERIDVTMVLFLALPAVLYLARQARTLKVTADGFEFERLIEQVDRKAETA